MDPRLPVSHGASVSNPKALPSVTIHRRSSVFRMEALSGCQTSSMKISIITASMNRKEFIGAAIESVLAQNYPDFEHWIIDGGSSDGTLVVFEANIPI